MRPLLLMLAIIPLCALAPAQTEPQLPLRLLVVGDFNGPYGTVGYRDEVAAVIEAAVTDWGVDLVLLPGDVVAGQDQGLGDERLAAMWQAFDEAVAAPLRQAGVPWVLAVGNHDGSSLRGAGGEYQFGRERLAVQRYWSAQPGTAPVPLLPGGAPPFHYALRFGPLLIAAWDASSATVDEGQRAWLEQVMASPEARGASLRLLVGHLPLVGIAEGRAVAGEVLDRGAETARWLASLGVDTYVSGHQAAFYPGRLGRLELLMGGGIGARPLLGRGAPARSAVVLVDVVEGAGGAAQVRYTAIDPATLQPLPSDALPSRISGFGGVVERSDRLR